MRILIAPDKFKGSLSAREVADNIAMGLRDELPDAKIDIVAVADGGEGTAEVISEALDGSWVKCRAQDPFGREIECRYAFIDKSKLAIMEMSEAAGMRRLQPNERDIDRANTFGVGEMILNAVQRGAKEIIMGLGGSATNDGGFGMARALGFRFFGDAQTPHLPPTRSYGATSNPLPLRRGEGRERSRDLELNGHVSELRNLSRIEKPKDLSLPKIIAAVDVRNPLLGKNGATRVFGPQKGATTDNIQVLECALTKLADTVAQDFSMDFRNEPGSGAAGGLGFGLMSFCGAKIRPGFEAIAELTKLEAKMKDVEVVITGEGSLDRQTLEGKAPAGVVKMARQLGKPVYAMVGRADKDQAVRKLFDGVYALLKRGVSERASIERGAELLRERSRELAKALKKTSNIEHRTSNED